MERKYDHNAAIIYVDPTGQQHTAFVTSWWGAEGASYDGLVYGNHPGHAYTGPTGEPECNLVYVSKDSMERDPYGRQIKRATSVVHKTKQSAFGNYWMWPGEEPNTLPA